MIEINKDTKLNDIMKEYPWLVDEAVKIDSRFKVLKSPIGRMFISKSTIEMLSEKAGLEASEIIDNITRMIKDHEGG